MATTKTWKTFANLQAHTSRINERNFCIERNNAEYVTQNLAYVAVTGDVTFANALIGKLINAITTSALIAGTVKAKNKTIQTVGFLTDGDGGKETWALNGVTGQTASQSPAQLADGLFNDADGDQWAIVKAGRINIRAFGAHPSNTAAVNNLAIQAAINYAETLIEQVTINIDIVTSDVYVGPGQYLVTALLLAQVNDGVVLVGDGQGVSVLACEGVGPAVTIGTESGSPNFSHIWLRDLTIRGGSPLFTSDDGDIVATSIGVKGSRLVRNCGIERCQIFGFDTNIELKDCFTFKLRDNHVHDSGTFLVNWQTALNGEITGGRYDDNAAANPLIVIDGQGVSNQVRDFRVTGVTFQESQVSALRFLDVSNAWVESNHFENNNQSGAAVHADIEFLQGTSNRLDGTLTLCDNFYTPGAASGVWTNTEFAVRVDAAKSVQCIGEKTGSSVYNNYIKVETNVEHVSLDGGVFTNMTADPISRASTATSIDEHYTKVDSAGVTTETVNRYKKGLLVGGYGLGMAHTISTTTGSISTNEDRTFFNMAGNGQALTLREEEETDGRAILVRKYSSSGTLTVTSAGSTQISLNGSSNNNAIIVATRGAAWFVFSDSSSEWICIPTSEDAGWALSA